MNSALGIELLQVALGVRETLSHSPSEAEWEEAYRFAHEQAIVGVLWPAVKTLSGSPLKGEGSVPMDLLMDWMGEANRLRERNREMDALCDRVTRNFREAGFESVVLKGQGNARLYESCEGSGDSCSMVRTPGDIDVWVFGERTTICKYLQENVPGYKLEKEGRLHTSFDWRGTTVEVHFTATIMECPKRERRLSSWLGTESVEMRDESLELKEVESLKFHVPSDEFNLVYLMLHMYRHYLFEGIGLRHVVDYILLWRRTTEEQHREAWETLEWLGAERFARAMMSVVESLELKTYNLEGLDWRGRMLWRAILEGGNFGKADKRNSREYRAWGWKRLWRFASRNAELIVAYPEEVGWNLLRKLHV